MNSTPGQRRERPRVDAELYITFHAPNTVFRQVTARITPSPRKAKLATQKRQKHQKLWDLAVQALTEADAAYAATFTSLAVTGNFRGSPHIDTENVAPFYALALGEFRGGGRIAVESRCARSRTSTRGLALRRSTGASRTGSRRMMASSSR